MIAADVDEFQFLSAGVVSAGHAGADREPATVPSKTLPLTERCPWNGQRGSLQPVFGALTLRPVFRTTISGVPSSLCPPAGTATENRRPQPSQSAALLGRLSFVSGPVTVFLWLLR